MAKASDRAAVIQFEFDRKRIRAMSRTTPANYSPTGANYQSHEIIRDALQDVFDNGGTLVVVVSAEKITVVQRPEAEDLEA